MDEVEGARTFAVEGVAYDAFMGRYSFGLAEGFADAAGVAQGSTALDVGCGPGALTGVLVSRLGAGAVSACDPSASFRDECAARHPGVVVKVGRAESLPFEDDSVDHAMAQLVLHFVSEPTEAASEMARVVRPGGHVSACVWDVEENLDMLRAFWDSALAIDPDAPEEARTIRFGGHGEIAELFTSVGIEDIVESTLRASSTYASFDELWSGFLGGAGRPGAYCASLSEGDRGRLRAEMFARIGAPTGSFTLSALARCAVGVVPG